MALNEGGAGAALSDHSDTGTLHLRARTTHPPPVEPMISAGEGPGRLTSIDLFAGAGGLTEGLARAGIRTVRAVESDLSAAATFEANHGVGTTYAGSIEDWLEGDDVPSADLVVGGPPCQGFSQLNRNRVGTERNSLWKHYAETIRRARPRWFVMENVATFLRSPEFERLQRWTRPDGPLADWSVEAHVLLASDFGAAQNRRRAVVLGSRRDAPRLRWPEATHVTRRRTVRDALAGIRPSVIEVDLPEGTTSFAGKRFPGTFRTDQLHLTRRYEDLSLRRFRAIPAGGNRFDLPDELKTPCWRAHTSGSGDVMGRLMWERPSVTIRTEFFKPEKGRYIHPTEHRAITHHEAARIQGFPDSYLWVGSKTEIARQIGNAVPVELAQALGSAITDAAGRS